jgi:hypothetical protein
VSQLRSRDGRYAPNPRSEPDIALSAPGFPAWSPPQSGLDTREGSFDQCKHTSAEYTSFLRQQGLAAEWVQTYGVIDDHPAAHPKWHTLDRKRWSHYITRVRNTDGTHVYVDWTARQFDPEAAYPVIADDSYSDGWLAEYPLTDAALDRYLDDIR